jgi:ketosteroid isomerase-like protein
VGARRLTGSAVAAAVKRSRGREKTTISVIVPVVPIIGLKTTSIPGLLIKIGRQQIRRVIFNQGPGFGDCLGYGIGYRRGMRDATSRSLPKATTGLRGLNLPGPAGFATVKRLETAQQQGSTRRVGCRSAPPRILLYLSLPAGSSARHWHKWEESHELINGRRAMNLSRRDLAAAAGVLALGAAAFAGPVLANTEDEAAVKKAVEELKAAWLKQDKSKLEAMTLPQLSYSHSDARLEDKAKFIEGVMGRKATVKSLEFPDMTVQVVGNTAIVRHLWVSQTELEGKVTDTKIGVMQVWQKQDGGWKLLARASYRLPQQA